MPYYVSVGACERRTLTFVATLKKERNTNTKSDLQRQANEHVFCPTVRVCVRAQAKNAHSLARPHRAAMRRRKKKRRRQRTFVCLGQSDAEVTRQ